jgi:hypothetical protein
MCGVEAVTKGGPYDDRSAHRSIGDFGIPVFHRPGWCNRPRASALNGVRDGSIPSRVQAREQILFDRIDGADYDLGIHFALRAEYRGFVYGRQDFDLASLHSGVTTHTAEPSAGIVFRF